MLNNRWMCTPVKSSCFGAHAASRLAGHNVSDGCMINDQDLCVRLMNGLVLCLNFAGELDPDYSQGPPPHRMPCPRGLARIQKLPVQNDHFSQFCQSSSISPIIKPNNFTSPGQLRPCPAHSLRLSIILRSDVQLFLSITCHFITDWHDLLRIYPVENTFLVHCCVGP